MTCLLRCTICFQFIYDISLGCPIFIYLFFVSFFFSRRFDQTLAGCQNSSGTRTPIGWRLGVAGIFTILRHSEFMRCLRFALCHQYRHSRIGHHSSSKIATNKAIFIFIRKRNHAEKESTGQKRQIQKGIIYLKINLLWAYLSKKHSKYFS